MQYIAQEHWQCCKSIHYQTWSCSRRLVTYISLVTAFSLFNPGKCVQFGRNCKVLEIVFPRCETEAKRCQGRPDSKIVHGCWNGWSCMPSSFSKWRSTMRMAVWESWNGNIHRGNTMRFSLTEKNYFKLFCILWFAESMTAKYMVFFERIRSSNMHLMCILQEYV